MNNGLHPSEVHHFVYMHSETNKKFRGEATTDVRSPRISKSGKALFLAVYNTRQVPNQVATKLPCKTTALLMLVGVVTR